MWKSTDGCTQFKEITAPHGDNHDLWIDPVNPRRMVEGNDGGACVSFNGGEGWSTIYNQCTAQFYRIDIDNQYPYRVYATQQDNTSISVPRASEWGVQIGRASCRDRVCKYGMFTVVSVSLKIKKKQQDIRNN